MPLRPPGSQHPPSAFLQMNSNALVRILAIFGLLIASLWVAFDMFAFGSNAVDRFYIYATVVSAV